MADLVKAGAQDPSKVPVTGAGKATVTIKKLSDERKKSLDKNKSPKPRDPWIMVGMCKRELLLQVKDRAKSAYETNVILIADYQGVKEKLAKAVVVNTSPRDAAVSGAFSAVAKKLGTTAKSPADANLQKGDT